MYCYEMRQEQTLPITMEEAWAFLSNPENLEAITPPDIGFKMLSEPETEAYAGQIIRYRIRIAPLVWITWVTEIKHVDKGISFVDEQRAGPYAFWHHRHTLETTDGGVSMRDFIVYAMPLGPIGRFVHWLWVGKQLRTIFAHRRKALDERFPQP